MRQMKKPEMEVIRFSENDIVVASKGREKSASINLSGFTGSVPKDGTVKFNGNSYSIASTDDVGAFLDAMRNYGISNAGISNGTTTQSLRSTLLYEVSTGARNWDGTFDYDPTVFWNNGYQDLNGVFIRQ